MKRNTHDIDALLRRQLGAIPEAPPDPAGWERLNVALDADADLHLRAALTGLVASADPTGWETLERKLDPNAAADAHVAEALNGLQPSVTGWATLVQRLDEGNHEAVDAVVVDRLARTAPTTTSGWAALAARLELIGKRRGLVAAWKITEFSLLLSALLLFLRFGPAVPLAPETPPAATPLDTERTAIIITEPQVEEVVVLKEEVSELAPAASPVSPPLYRLSTESAPKARSSQLSPKGVTPAPQRPRNAVATAPIPTLEYRAERDAHLPSPALQLPVFSKAVPVRYYANAFVSPFDANQVITPSTQVRNFDISADDRITQGYSAGFLLDIMQGRNGLQIGAIYARRSYIPTALKWYLQEEYPIIEPVRGFSRFVHHTVAFPLNYQRVIATNDKWRFSARVGMSMTVIASSEFQIGDQEELIDAFNGRLDRHNLPDLNTSGRSPNFTSSRKLTNPEPGWLEGGSLLQNASFYLGGGIMAERLISPRWSVYASPSFGRVVYFDPDTGIGPYNDRIHVGSLRLGARYLMSNK